MYENKNNYQLKGIVNCSIMTVHKRKMIKIRANKEVLEVRA
jgi:hypothetical protein